MFLSLKHREELGLKEPEHTGEVTVLPSGVTNNKDERIQKLRNKDITEPSFKANSEKEEGLLKYLEHFVLAFEKAHPSRGKLFIAPFNECGIPKFVCTTLRPTKMPHVEMYHAKSCAKFVAGFINFEPLAYATEAPRCLPSPKTVLKWQIGDPFDSAMVLASFLIGSGYDAYVVKGYAPKWVTWRDQSKQECPALDLDSDNAKANENGTRDEASGNQQKSEDEELMYPIKRPNVGQSKYEQLMKERMSAELARLAEAEKDLLAEEEVPEESDPLEGKRVHAWVLLVPNSRSDIRKYTMIEATTGTLYSLEDAPYVGVEQVWNHTNHFINMQGTSVTASQLQWDLNEVDSPNWLPVFRTGLDNVATKGDDEDVDSDEEDVGDSAPETGRLSSPRSPAGSGYNSAATSVPGSPRDFSSAVGADALPSTSGAATPKTAGSGRNTPGGSKPGTARAITPALGGNDNAAELELKPSAVSTVPALEIQEAAEVMPPPWCPFLRIPQSVFNSRYGGKKHEKVVLYKRAKHEMFPKHSHSEGLTSRVTLYDDDEYTIPIETREEFCARTDQLASRIRKPLEGLTSSFFEPGRPRKLRELHEVMGRSLTMIFDAEARLDGLEKREEVFGESLTEHFRGRSDKLFHRSVTMVPDETGPGSTGASHSFTIQAGASGEFLIEQMVQEFGRDESKPAAKDVAKRVFSLLPAHKQKVVEFTHYGKNRILQESREYVKADFPQNILNVASGSGGGGMADGTGGGGKGRDSGAGGGAGGKSGESSSDTVGAEFLAVLQAERECYQAIRASKREVELILKSRQDEEAEITVTKTIFETVRDRQGAPKKDEQEEQEEETAVQSDYLTAFLPEEARGLVLNQGEKGAGGDDDQGIELTKEQAQRAADACLNALKKRLVERASIIQRRLDSENEKLSKRQALFQRSRDASESVDDEYEKFCQEAMFRIQILEKRFQKHEETAFQKYEEMIARLDADPRLAAKNT